MQPPPPSYYESTVLRPPPDAPLAGDASCDVCVIGGGFCGLSAAMELARRGRKVILVEENNIGWGASGRNGGQCLHGYSSDDLTLPARQAGVSEKMLFDISAAAVDLVKQRIAENDIACDFQGGHLLAATKPRHCRELEKTVDTLTRRYDYPVQLLNAPQTREIIASRRYCGALLDERSGHLHPLKYALGLAAAAKKSGVTIYENSAAIGFAKRDRRRLVKTKNGDISCACAILAGNAYQGELIPKLRARIMPVGTYIGATIPLGDVADKLIGNRACVCDMNFVLDYFRCTADKRLLFGGRVSYSNSQPANLESLIRGRIKLSFPQIGEVRLAYLWGGSVAITLNRMPDIGRRDGDIYYAHGFSGHGVALSGMAGKIIADAIVGDDEKLALFQKIKHRPFIGGRTFRMPILALAMLYHRLRDWL